MHKAIETKYKGYRFRSRLEARYAVMFDALKIKWEYEPEGFESDKERYLPDFRLTLPTGVEVWVEVKGNRPRMREIEKFHRLCVSRKFNGIFLWGSPGDNQIFVVRRDWPEFLCIEYLDEGPSGMWKVFDLNEVCLTHNGMCPDDAIVEAKSARFEFGETP